MMDCSCSEERLFFDATQRNREPIARVLEPLLPSCGLLLEIASGSGEHLCYLQNRFGSSHPELHWQGSDPEPLHRASLVAWARHLQLPGRLPPLDLDATKTPWPRINPVMILCINMVHIAPWQASEGLFEEAGRQLMPGRLLVLYGPFFENSVTTSPSNEAFDAHLRNIDSRWGLRHLDQLEFLAKKHWLGFAGRWTMPANNLMIAFRRLEAKAS